MDDSPGRNPRGRPTFFAATPTPCFAQLAGGRLFPGIHHPGEFRVTDESGTIDFAMTSRDGGADIHLRGAESDALPPTSCFRSLTDSSRFFESGSLGYSPAHQPDHFDGLRLETARWSVQPFAVSLVRIELVRGGNFPTMRNSITRSSCATSRIAGHSAEAARDW